MITRMRISLISTVLNEENNIRMFVASLLSQKRRPDEIIIVDGGSKDKTYIILKEISKKNRILKVMRKIGANISMGRNIAIRRAKYETIAVCDAGGRYDKNWLLNLETGFNGEVGFGLDKPLIRSSFHKNLARAILHKNVEGSSRNMIFSKSVWKKVGGYPEDLLIGEDSLFDERIKHAGYHIGRINNAICYWEMRPNYEAFKKQFYKYGYWDGISYRRYKMIPLKHKLAVLYTLILFVPFYALDKMIKRETVLKIRINKRIMYLKGFMDGYRHG